MENAKRLIFIPKTKIKRSLFDICFRPYNKSHINLEYVEANCCETHLNGSSRHKANINKADGSKMEVIGQFGLCKIFRANRYHYH